MKEYEVTVISSEMPEDVEIHAARVASEALVMEPTWSGIAGFIKKAFDKKYSTSWHCVVGKHFCGSFSHEMGDFIHFSIDDVIILLFRSFGSLPQTTAVASSI
ncbi:unnamed protein product [Heterobilharzia americana]|nr:unnamed protein product [Heterobilharzia americana]